MYIVELLGGDCVSSIQHEIDTMNHLYSQDDFELAEKIKDDITRGICDKGLIIDENSCIDEVTMTDDGDVVKDVLVKRGSLSRSIMVAYSNLITVRFDYIVAEIPIRDFSTVDTYIRMWFRDMDPKQVWWMTCETSLSSSFSTINKRKGAKK